jgi:hypothetical protein
MGLFGNIGRDAGAHLGQAAGDGLGRMLGFKKGGKVPGKRGAPKLAVVHGGEYILPLGVKPTLAQKKKVSKGKKGKK